MFLMKKHQKKRSVKINEILKYDFLSLTDIINILNLDGKKIFWFKLLITIFFF